MRPSSIPAAPQDRPTIAERIGERYLVRALLGRGGMGAVYRVSDGEGGRELALKQLQLGKSVSNRAAVEALFEQEFSVLAQLDHPRVIRVYDYGWDPAGPYYTMELLHGNSLTECSPLPWREACALIHDVCSSLSLLHVRGLVHRDVSPHNVRRTLDGRAKLIDFGAMAPIGPSEQVIGTPAFAAPEVVHRLSLDGRTDLYSLGATLYFALSGRSAYSARNFAQLAEAWADRPAPPSLLVNEIPAQLDALVMAMLSLEPALRPRSASEVMLQLATLVGRDDAEHADVSRAYLSTPSLVGRDELRRRFEQRVTRARTRAGSGLVIQGAPGLGRTRALEACALLAQTRGAVVTRVNAHAAGAQPFAAAQLLTDQLARTLPEVCAAVTQAAQISERLFEPPNAHGSEPLAYGHVARGKLRDALSELWLRIARERLVLIAVDDIERLDEPSAAWLATLATQLKRHHLLLACTATASGRATQPALGVIAEHSARYDLAPLSADQTEHLLLSAFGDVPRVALLRDRVYRVTQGQPRACMDLVRYLIDRGTIRYEGGTWLMPEVLGLDDLPATLDDARAARIAALSPQARRLSELLASSIYGALSQHDCALLLNAQDAALDPTLAELLEQGILACSAGGYVIADETWSAALARGLHDAERAERHATLGQLGQQTQRAVVATAYHFFRAELGSHAFDTLLPLLTQEADWGPDALSEATLSRDQICEVFRWGISYAEQHARRPRELADVRRWLMMLSVQNEHYRIATPGLLAMLRQDSGLADWRELGHISDAGERLGKALTQANERHQATPEPERGYGVQDAIKYLVQYVLASIVYGTRSLNAETLCSLPPLLEPFVALSPVIDAIHQNAIAARECTVEGRYHQARARWEQVYARLDHVTGADLHHVQLIRSAILYGLGTLEAARGLPTAAARADELDKEPLQMVSAMYLRRVIRLQQGDFEGAERFRRRAELLAVQGNARQMFTTFVVAELIAYGTARDLTAVRESAARIESLAEGCPGYKPYQLFADGTLKFLRGDLNAAARSLEQALELCWPDPNAPRRAIGPLTMTAATYLEVLLALEAYPQAKEFGVRALAEAARYGLLTTDEVERGLALAEAKLGDPEGAIARLDAVIARQRAQGVSGLHLGTQYEARARVAIWTGDQEALAEYGKLAAQQYRHGRGSPLGARYERLLSEARDAGVPVLPELSEFETSTLGTQRLEPRAPSRALLHRAVRNTSNAQERASAIVRMLGEINGSASAHLFLIRADGNLRWAASHGEAQHGDSEIELARQCVDRALNDDFGSTQLESELSTARAGTSAIWNDAVGIPHHVQLLTGSYDGDPRYVAVAIATAPRSLRQYPSLLKAIAEYLLSNGDAEGLAVG